MGAETWVCAYMRGIAAQTSRTIAGAESHRPGFTIPSLALCDYLNVEADGAHEVQGIAGLDNPGA